MGARFIRVFLACPAPQGEGTCPSVFHLELGVHAVELSSHALTIHSLSGAGNAHG